MKPLDCQWLDDYLAGELPCDWLPLFAQHVEDCPSCSEEVVQWRALRAKLSRASRTLEPPPAALLQSIQTICDPAPSPSRKPSRARRFAAAVAVCLMAGLFFAVFTAQRNVPEVSVEDHVAEVTPPRSVTHVELPDDVIGVPIDIGDPDVTVVWVYPVYQPDGDED